MVIVGLGASLDQGTLISNLDRRLDTFEKLRAARGPISSLYISLFLFPALLTLVGASWLPFVLARRFARPVRNVALAAERIAAGERGVRVETDETDEEFVKLIRSFNLMSERLARSEEEVEFSRSDLTRKNLEIDERRRLMETVLETIGTGVLVVDGEQKVKKRELRRLATPGRRPRPDRGVAPRPRPPAEIAGEVTRSIARVLEGRSTHFERDLALFGGRGRREVRIRARRTRRPGPGTSGRGHRPRRRDPADAGPEGRGLGRGRAQARPRDQEPAHSDQALGPARAQGASKGAPDFDRVLSESIEAIVSEVDALAASGRRVRAVRPPASLETRRRIAQRGGGRRRSPCTKPPTRTSSLDRKFDPELPSLARRWTPDQAGGHQPGRQRDRRAGRKGLDRDQHPLRSPGAAGFPDRGGHRARAFLPSSRETIFAPNFSTKRKGSGLGLAIARRIVEDHGGEIRVEDNSPQGARFVIELPA